MILLIKEFRKCYWIYFVKRLDPSASPPPPQRKLQNWENAVNEDKERHKRLKKRGTEKVCFGAQKIPSRPSL
jgi:hypothetical protein